MSPDPSPLDRLIWATRGRRWGFRFLLDAGLPDPLAEYERSFAGRGDEPTIWRRSDDRVVLRLPDPLRRRDTAGRVIPHDFVVFGALADDVNSVDDGLLWIWPLVAEAYARVWDAEAPPSRTQIRGEA